MNTNDLWQKLFENKLVKQQTPPTHDASIQMPWYISAIHGFSGWLAAFFLLAFFATAFNFLFVKATALIAISAGVICSAITYLIVKSHKTHFLEQLGIAISLCGQLMVALGLFYLSQFSVKQAFYMLAGYQLLLAWVIPQYIHRFLTCGFGLISLLIGFNLSGLYGVGSAILSITFSFIWLKEARWGQSRQKWQAIGMAVATTLVISSGFLLTDRSLLTPHLSNTGWLFEHTNVINSFFIALVFLNTVIILLKENSIAHGSKTGMLSLLSAAGLVAISFKIYGLSAGLLIAIIGFARARYSLIILGGIAVITFFSWYYYQLDHTLLFKSVVLIILGVVLLGSWLAIQSFFHDKPLFSKKLRFSPFRTSQLLVFITMAVILLSTNHNIYQKQQLISTGETLLFKLAPADPRSIMQGDYMRLRFEAAVDAREALRKRQQNQFIQPHKGHIIVEKHDNNTVSFVALYDQQTLKPQQYKIPYKYHNYRVTMITDAFYFQEGKAQHFQKAEFGQFKRADDGELLLVNLVDENLAVL